MSEPIVFGAAYSVYVRSVRLVLEEKGVPYRLEEVDIFADGGPPPDHAERHPFGRIPAFEHGGFKLYESNAISRHINEVFPDPDLMPPTPEGRAQVNQILSILDSYAYRTLVWDIYVERVDVPQSGGESDESGIAAALPKARTCLSALEAIMDGRPYLAGPVLTLADLHAVPVFAYFRKAPEGRQLLADHADLCRWWKSIASRPSVTATRSSLEDG